MLKPIHDDIFRIERATYEARKPNLLAFEGKYVVVKGEWIDGPFDEYEDALRAGYKQHGLVPFMVKKIEAVEMVHRI